MNDEELTKRRGPVPSEANDALKEDTVTLPAQRPSRGFDLAAVRASFAKPYRATVVKVRLFRRGRLIDVGGETKKVD